MAEHKLELPGDYHIVTSKGQDYTVLNDEDINCSLDSVIPAIQGREFKPEESLCELMEKTCRVTLNRNPSNTVFTTRINGAVIIHPVLGELRINRLGWEPKDLARFLRLNQHLIHETEQNNIVKMLLTVHTTRAKSTNSDTKGNRADTVSKTTTLPDYINFHIPIIQQGAKRHLRVEVDVSPDDDLVYLVYPMLASDIEEHIESTFGEIISFCNLNDIPVVTVV